jgi:hypothetical protein
MIRYGMGTKVVENGKFRGRESLIPCPPAAMTVYCIEGNPNDDAKENTRHDGLATVQFGASRSSGSAGLQK